MLNNAWQRRGCAVFAAPPLSPNLSEPAKQQSWWEGWRLDSGELPGRRGGTPATGDSSPYTSFLGWEQVASKGRAVNPSGGKAGGGL